MKKERRLTRGRDFQAVHREGRRWSDRLLVLIARPNDSGASRVGLSVGKRVGGAVVRNRVKRRLREAVDLCGVEDGWDMVLIARKDAPSAQFHGLARSVASLLGRAGIGANELQASARPPKTT